MSGEKNRKMDDPVLISLLFDRSMIVKLDRQKVGLQKKHGFTISRSELIRAILQDYLKKLAV